MFTQKQAKELFPTNKNFVLLETSLNSKLLKKNVFFLEYIKGYFYFLDMREEYVVV
jgi:hypothetical protein